MNEKGMIRILVPLVVFIVAVALPTATTAFQLLLQPRSFYKNDDGSSSSVVALDMARIKRGLALIVEDDGSGSSAVPPTEGGRRKSNKPTVKSGGKKAAASSSSSSATPVSPDLLKFMQSKAAESSSSRTTSPPQLLESVEESTATVFTSFGASDDDDGDSSSSSAKTVASRRIKQSVRMQLDEERTEKVKRIVETLEEAVSSGATTNNNSNTNMVEAVLGCLEQLLNLEEQYSSSSSMSSVSSLKQLCAGTTTATRTAKQQPPRRLDYRLIWVGSDDAVCHVGTALHKVPLARLQEVFLSLPGRNRIQWTEVIRILGPFPNVRNILQGATTSSAVRRRSSGAPARLPVADWKLVWDSMIDGTGKEVLAGKEENTRTVHLHVYYSDEQIIVAAVPPEADDDGGGDYEGLLRDNRGQHVLVFVRDEAMEDKLEALRVA